MPDEVRDQFLQCYAAGNFKAASNRHLMPEFCANPIPHFLQYLEASIIHAFWKTNYHEQNNWRLFCAANNKDISSKENRVSFHNLERRFGVIAVKKGFITKDQLIEALSTQVIEEFMESGHRSICQILFEKEYITALQIKEVLAFLGIKIGLISRVQQTVPQCN